MSFIEELKRRNVFRVGLAYVLLGWVVMQAADFALDLIDAPNWVIQVFFIAGLIGLPFALFFAWAYELTPEGIKREEDVDRSISVTPQTGRKLDKAIIAFLATAVVLLLADRFYPSPEPPAPTGPEVTNEPLNVVQETGRKSIAVLPFVNMSSDTEQDFFSDGISEEILNALSKVDELKVAGRTSSFAFKGQSDDLRQIGQTLGVDHILEGSVRTAGERVRISAQLVQVEDGFHLWSETYDRELNDIFAIQDDIANRILEAMKTTLAIGPVASDITLDVVDYNKFLMGRQLMRERREQPLQQARALFTEVNENAPDYAPAWAERAITVMLLRDDVSSYGSLPTAQAMALARAHLERAEALAPENAETLAGLGLYYDNAGQTDLAIDYLQQALAINPNLTDARNWLWRQLWRSGRLQEAVTLNRQTRDLDPLYLPTATNISFDYLVLGLDSELADHYEQVKQQLSAVDDRYVRGVEAALAFSQADYARAVQSHRPTDDTDDLWSWMRSLALLQLGEPAWAARLAAGTPGEIEGLALTGRFEEAMMVARPLVANGSGIREYISVLVADERHAEVVRFFDERWPSLQAFEDQVLPRGLDGGQTLGRLVEAFRATGDEARAEQFMARFDEMLAETLAAGGANHWLTFSQAYHATLQSDADAAIDHLGAFADSGHFVPPDFTGYWQSFEFLRGEPRFEAVVARMTEQMNVQRARLSLPPYEERLSG